MSAARRNGRRTIFCWCKSACAKAPAAQEKPVRTLSAQKNAGRFAPGNTAFLGRFVQMRRENGRILHKSAACFCTLCLVVTNVRGNTPCFPSHLPSSPARGTWIEISSAATRSASVGVVPRKGDVDRNFCLSVFLCNFKRSSPARGTWIEMNSPLRTSVTVQVVPRKGDVDRNFAVYRQIPGIRVVPRKGDVDRNLHDGVAQLAPQVVPRKGDVDRNVSVSSLTVQLSRRPPQGGRG